MRIDEDLKQSVIASDADLAGFAGMKVRWVETMDRTKFLFDNPGLGRQAQCCRDLAAVGTPRYGAAVASVESVSRVLAAAQAFVLKGSSV
jgi:hypothetical protein